jgi:hypothetical protein
MDAQRVGVGNDRPPTPRSRGARPVSTAGRSTCVRSGGFGTGEESEGPRRACRAIAIAVSRTRRTTATTNRAAAIRKIRHADRLGLATTTRARSGVGRTVARQARTCPHSGQNSASRGIIAAQTRHLARRPRAARASSGRSEAAGSAKRARGAIDSPFRSGRGTGTGQFSYERMRCAIGKTFHTQDASCQNSSQ